MADEFVRCALFLASTNHTFPWQLPKCIIIISDFARCKVKRTIAVVSFVNVRRTECEAASAIKSSKTTGLPSSVCVVDCVVQWPLRL